MKKFIVILFGVMLLSTACGQKTSEVPSPDSSFVEESTVTEPEQLDFHAKEFEPSEEIKTAEIADYKYQIGENTYTLPIKLGDLFSDENVHYLKGWYFNLISDEEFPLLPSVGNLIDADENGNYITKEQDLNCTISAKHNFHLQLFYRNEYHDYRFDVDCVNPYDTDKSMLDCYVYLVSVPYGAIEDITLETADGKSETINPCPFILPKGYRANELKVTDDDYQYPDNAVVKAYGEAEITGGQSFMVCDSWDSFKLQYSGWGLYYNKPIDIKKGVINEIVNGEIVYFEPDDLGKPVELSGLLFTKDYNCNYGIDFIEGNDGNQAVVSDAAMAMFEEE